MNLSEGKKRQNVDSEERPRKAQRITQVLSNTFQTATDSNKGLTENNLEDFLMSIARDNGIEAEIRPAHSIKGFFCDPTEEEIKAYSHEVLTAVKTQDLQALRSFREQGRPLKCSNRFGESILHLACRKGMADVVDFLVNDAGVPLSIRDDYGRTPLHDACWAATPNFDLIDLVIRKCPDLLYISDQRGYTPLSYAKQEYWPRWKTYLKDNVQLLRHKNIGIKNKTVET